MLICIIRKGFTYYIQVPQSFILHHCFTVVIIWDIFINLFKKLQAYVLLLVTFRSKKFWTLKWKAIEKANDEQANPRGIWRLLLVQTFKLQNWNVNLGRVSFLVRLQLLCLRKSKATKYVLYLYLIKINCNHSIDINGLYLRET